MSNLASLEDVLELAKKALDPNRPGFSLVNTGQLYCPFCGDYRKMRAEKYLTSLGSKEAQEDFRARSITEGPSPLRDTHLFRYTCLQCEAIFTALVYIGPDGPSLIILPSVHGGLSTPNTPAAIKYYLDQAYRSQIAGANSAAIVMFRSALEHLLYEQGYVNGMLGMKISDLENGRQVTPKPKWATDLNPAYLKVLKDLGNGAVHTNGGDISLQIAFDNELIEKVKLIFHRLLDMVYEEPIREAQLLQGLQNTSKPFKK